MQIYSRDEICGFLTLASPCLNTLNKRLVAELLAEGQKVTVVYDDELKRLKMQVRRDKGKASKCQPRDSC